MQKHRFSVPVSCRLPCTGSLGERLANGACLYEDYGFLLLPDSYCETGAPTRLVISCHGAGGTVTTDDSQVEHQALTKYLVANGFAVMDVNGLPARLAEEQGIDLRNNIGSPIAIAAYVKAYRYCVEHFNLKREVLVHGGSMGGISSTNLVLSGLIPVLAHSALCPVLDTYHEIFLHPWSGGLPREALGKLYGLEKDADGHYRYDGQRIGGFDPATNGRATRYPVPVKFWHCEDDPTVSFALTAAFVERIRAAGGNAQLRALPSGGHEPQLVGPPVTHPTGNTHLAGETLQILPVVEEVLLWMTAFDQK